MKALFLTGLKQIELREAPAPEAPKGWLRVRVRRVGICGSDIHYYMTGAIGDQVVRYPFTLGHESAGEVLDGGGKLAKGARVFIEPGITCGECTECRAGRENMCLKLRFLGNPLDIAGSMCEEICMPPRCVIPLPEAIGPDEATLIEPMSIAVHAVKRSGIGRGCRAAIIGAGPIGLSVLTALSALEPKSVYQSEPVEARRKAALALGATATSVPGPDGAHQEILKAAGGGVDAAFECVGSQEAIDDAVRVLRPNGVLVLIGIPEGTSQVVFDPHYIRRRELTLVTVRRQNRCVEAAIALLSKRRDAHKVLITHHFPAARAREAFDLVQQKGDGVIKAVLHFD